VGEVVIRKGVRAVVVRGAPGSTYDDAFLTALEVAQKGLDLLSATGIESLGLTDAADEHLVWWTGEEGPVVRFRGVVAFNMTVHPATLTVYGPDGQPKPSPPVPAAWHESMRYFRHAQVTDDLFDAFRNLYLALESALSEIAPMRLGEREGMWVKRALGEANLRVRLASFAPGNDPSPVDALYDEVYKKVRNAVFHAKRNREVLLPHDWSAREKLQAAAERLGELYLALLEEICGVQFATAGIYRSAWRARAEPIPVTRLYVLPQSVGPGLDQGVAEPKIPSDAPWFPLSRAPDFDDPWLVAYWATVPCVRSEGRPPVVRELVATSDEGVPFFGFDLEGPLDLSGFKELQVAVGVRGTNTRTLRKEYST
jgi:hypothetical protein